MEKPLLNDQNQYPDNAVLSQILGDTMPTWVSFTETIERDFPNYTTEWRFYQDGKSWLFKAFKKTKTICWASVWDKFFKVTFYFNDKAEEVIKSSTLPEAVKQQFFEREKIGKIRPITIEAKSASELLPIKTLLTIKDKLK